MEKINISPKISTESLKCIIKELTFCSPITIIRLKNYLINNTNYPVELLSRDIEILHQQNKVIFHTNGIEYYYPRLLDFLSSSCYDRNTSMLNDKCNGMTLEEIGQKYGVTRERARQIIETKYQKLPYLYEERYRNMFEKYRWSEKDFTRIFNVNKTVYYFLKMKSRLGNKDLLEAMKDNELDERQISIILSLRKPIKLFNKDIKNDRRAVFTAVIERHAQEEMTTDRLSEIYNNIVKKELKDYNLEPINPRSIEGVASRLGVAIFGAGKKIRYYNYDSLMSEDIFMLKNLMNIKNGYYSTSYIFNNNLELMKTLDIRNIYELHSIIKRYLELYKNITMLKMPNFLVGYKDKKIFLEEKINELSPISKDKFFDILSKEYGHKISSLDANLSNYLESYMENGVISMDYTKLTDSEANELIPELNKEFYTIKEIKDLLIKKGHNSNDIINCYNLGKLGYEIKGGFVVSKNIISFEKYLLDKISGIDFICNDDFLRSDIFFNIIKRFERDYAIVKISQAEYITIKKLENLGIKKENIIKFCEDVEKCYHSDFFSIKNVRNDINIELFNRLGFDDIFFESIIGTIDGIKAIRIANQKVFLKSNEKISMIDLLVNILEKKRVISIDDLSDYLFDYYGILVDEIKIKNTLIISKNLYYNQILNKIYYDKRDYYNEVYSYE